MTPLSTRQSLTSPPGSFSTLAYRLTSTSGGPPDADGVATIDTASSASSASSGPNRDVNLVPMHALSTVSIEARSAVSTSKASDRTASRAASAARV